MADRTFLKLINGDGTPPKGLTWEEHVIHTWQAYKALRKTRKEKEIIASYEEIQGFVRSLRLLQPYRKLVHLGATLHIFDMLYICCAASLKHNPDQQNFMGETAYRWAVELVDEKGNLRLSSMSLDTPRMYSPVLILREMILSRQINFNLDLGSKIKAWKGGKRDKDIAVTFKAYYEPIMYPEQVQPFMPFIDEVHAGLPDFQKVENIIALREKMEFSYDQSFWKSCIRALEADIKTFIRDVRALQAELAEGRREFSDYTFVKNVGTPPA